MPRKKIIQVHAFAIDPIGVITYEARKTVSKICLGIDDMQLLGNKALVIRAEIYPERLRALYAAIVSTGITLNENRLPDIDALQEGVEYPISIQITSLSDDTDRSIRIPKVPG